MNSLLDNFKSLLGQSAGSKSYLAGLGLLALAFYQVTQGDVAHGVANAMTGLGIIGVRHAIERQGQGPGDGVPPAPPTTPAPPAA